MIAHRHDSGRTILVVADESARRAALAALLEHGGHHVATAVTDAEALAALADHPAHAIVVHSPAASDRETLIRRVRERDALVPIVLQTMGAAPREVVTNLAIQGHHDERDGAERLLLCVDLALKAYDQLAQLQVAERLKTELLANVSHEFRTPLNVIVGYVDLLREGTFGACPPDSVPVLDKVRGNASYLLELVEEFLDLSRVEAGAVPVRRETVHLTPLLRELGDWFTLIVRARPVRFVTDVPDDLPPVAAETAKLRVVIQNLLSNAAKFTERGEVRLSAACVGAERVAIRITDTGPGIAREHHETIFDIFRQLGVQDRGGKGIGLGLALARRFARMMGGDITVESEVGTGSTFTVVLPVSAEPPGAVVPDDAAA